MWEEKGGGWDSEESPGEPVNVLTLSPAWPPAKTVMPQGVQWAQDSTFATR